MMRKKLPADRAMGAQKPIDKPQWRATALAIATAVLFGISASDASALALGRVTVQSALGEPLRAEIEIPEINADEVASLRAAIASPEAFRAAGFDYNPAMSNIQITLQRRPNGTHVLQLSSQRAVNDPFIDLILEANWSSGRMVRDYTLLFDPPNLRPSAAPLAAEVPAATPSAATPASTARQASPSAPSPPTAPSARGAGQRPQAGAKTPSGEGKQVTVQSGDTAGRIAAANKPTSVSLDQMLMAMLQANPEAFVNGNVNRLKAGVVLEMPTAEQAELMPSAEARQNIVAQSRDFNDFRRRLAEGVPATNIGGTERQSSGRVQAQVEEKKPAAGKPDRLTLSKGAVQGKGAADKIARDRAARDDATRVAELNKNLSDLNKLGTATGPAPVAAASAAKPGVAIPAVSSAAKPASAPAAAAPTTLPAASAKPSPAATPLAAASAAKPGSAPAAASIAAPPASTAVAAPGLAASAPVVAAAVSAPVASAAAPAASAAAPAASAAGPTPAPVVVAVAPAMPASKPRAAPPPPPETSLVDDLLENPMVPASVGGVLALLLGFGFYRAQQRKKSTQVDSSFLESRLQPDSFFGASGGQRIDTNEGNATGSSMVYSPSQLDAAGDVDPVAEADVYLAYGRDLQAEEILKEAMRTTPQRLAVHSKLLEIYSKRRDAKAFELIASEAYALSRGEGPEWEHICELGQELDSANPLYRPGGQPAKGQGAVPGAKTDDFSSQATQTMPVAPPAEAAADIDLDLDFSIGDDSTAPVAPVAAPVSRPAAAQAPAVADPMPTLDMDFGATAPVETRPDPVRIQAPGPNVAGNSLNLNKTQPISLAVRAAAPVAAAPAAPDAGMIEFDLGALSLDLDAPAADAIPKAAAPALKVEEAVDSTAGAPLSTGGLEDDSGGDPLATKLALAQEFNAIGDPDGARSLAEEVLAEASGDLKQKAQRFLAEIA
jgi:pilus assembly protein FimV